MSIHNPARLLSKRRKLSKRKKKKLVNIITSEPHIQHTINGAINMGRFDLAMNLMNSNFKINYGKIK